jgi:hypothetical protein
MLEHKVGRVSTVFKELRQQVDPLGSIVRVLQKLKYFGELVAKII